jgi:hypothetical protein
MENGLQTILGDGTSVNSYEADGEVTKHPFKVSANYPWDDFSFPVSGLRINPATSKPDYDQNEIEFLFDAGTTETVVGVQISRHEFAQDQLLWMPHVHWVQDAVGNVVWQLEYKIWAANTVEPVGFTAISAFTPEFAYTSGSIHQITSLPDIDVTPYSSSTAMVVKIKISRLGGDSNDTKSGDARFMSFDFHVQIDAFGSRQEFIK